MEEEGTFEGDDGAGVARLIELPTRSVPD